MKRALTVVLFLLFTIGVCVDGNEDSVSVTERDSVTLKSGVTERQTDDEIEWKFDVTRIAKISSDSTEPWVKPDGSFRDRLQLDRQTGDLKISNIRTTDSGEYKVKIKSPRGSPEMTFTVNVVSAAEVKSVPLLEGDSVTLLIVLTEKQRDDVIQWRFGQQKSPVAEINRDARIFNTYDGPDGRFRDRLKLDQTGSLTITNTRTTDSGLYEADIIRTSSKHTIHKTFSLTVSDAVKSLSVMEGESVTLPITEIKNDDLIWWMFGNLRLAEIDKAATQFFIIDIPDKSFRNRLELDHQTGSLIINNTKTTDSGDYKLKISNSRNIIHRRITVTVTALPDSRLSPDDLDPRLSSDGPGLSPAAVAGIVVGVGVLLAAAAAAGVICYRHKRSKEVIHMQMDASQMPLDNGDPGTKENEYDSL